MALSQMKRTRIASIIGCPGSGKTSIVKWLISELNVDGYEVIVVSSIKEWRKYVDPSRKQIVVIEDIFGSTQFDPDACNAWLDLYFEIQLAIKQGFLYVVITSRNIIYNEARIPEIKNVFLHTVDLTQDKCKLTQAEQREMLIHHMASCNRNMLSMKAEIESFVFQHDAIIGFPECCRLFCMDDALYEKGIGFFKRPSHYLNDLLISMSRKMPYKFSALIYCMLHGGILLNKCCQLKKCRKLDIALEACGIEVHKSAQMLDQMSTLLGSFLVSGDNEVLYKIQHQIVLDALVDVFSNHCHRHDVILEYADLEFIANNSRIDNWSESQYNYITLQDTCFEQLWNRMKNELGSDSLMKLVLGGLLLKHEGFISFCVNWLINKNTLIDFLELNDNFLLKSNLSLHHIVIEFCNTSLMKKVTNPDVVDYILKCDSIVDRRQLISLLLLWSSAVCNNETVTSILLSQESDPGIRGMSGITPLHCAAQTGSIGTVQELLERKVQQEATYNKNVTPLHIAAWNGNVKIILLLIKYGARRDVGSVDHFTALHYACMNINSTMAVQFLLDIGSYNATVNKVGVTCLHVASLFGHTGACELLLDYGADHTADRGLGLTPLQVAVFNGHTDTVRLLLKRGASHAVFDVNGTTPLHFAVVREKLEVVRLLLDSGAKHTAVDNGGFTPLHEAVLTGGTDIVRLLLERGASHATVDVDDSTPLHMGSQNGNLDIVKLLLDRGASHAAVDRSHRFTPLHDAVFAGHTDIVRLLLDRNASHYSADVCGNTPLHIGSQEGHIDIVKLLLDRCAILEAKNVAGGTPLHMAAHAAEDNTDMIKLLLDRGASHTAYSKDKTTALHIAVIQANINTARLLLERGANHATYDENGITPLHWASNLGYIDIVKLLLDRGANHAAHDEKNNTSLHLACEKGHTNICRLLLDNGASQDEVGLLGRTPLHIAAEMGHTEIVKLVLDRGADLSSVDMDGSTPLHIAAVRGNAGIAELMLDRGAVHAAVDVGECTPLHSAAYYDHIDTVKLLLDRHADHTVVNSAGLTPLQIASQMNSTNVIRLLSERDQLLNLYRLGYAIILAMR